MNVWKRAILYLIRSWKKTLLIFCLLSLVSTLVLSGLGILDAQEKRTDELKGTTGTSFTVERNLSTGSWSSGENGSYNTQEFLTDEMIEAIAKTEGIKDYTGLKKTILCLFDMEDTPLEKMEPVGYPAVDCQFYSYGCDNLEYISFFLNGTLKMTEGDFITPETENGIVISKDIADKHGLKIGDRLQAVNDPYSDDPAIELKIVGLYEIAIDKTDERNSYNEASYYDYTEYSFVSMDTMKELLINYAEGKYCDSADFFVSDPEKLEQTIQNVQKIDVIDWNNFVITANDEVYERIAGSVSDMKSLIKILIGIVTIVSVVIIILILSAWIKGRKKEIGILLAVGTSKTMICIQYIMEMLMISVLAFPVSFFICRIFADGLAGILKTSAESGVVITPQHFMFVTGAGMILVVFSVLVSCIPVMKYTPKELLSQMK